jgi:hypothetical protein
VKFKVGDKVCIVSDSIYSYQNEFLGVGQILIVFDDREYSYRVTSITNKSGITSYREEDLRLATPLDEAIS